MAQSQTSDEEEDKENVAADPSCRTHILSIVYRCLSDCLLCRMISCVFTLQAGIIWLGCKCAACLLFFADRPWFQLHWISFFNCSFYRSINIIHALFSVPIWWFRGPSLCECWSRFPIDCCTRLCSSSAHYFWYIVQTACHAFQRDVPTDRSTVIQPADFLLLLINANRVAKRIYRLLITLATITCMIYYSTRDSWQMLIITAGEVPLILMWALNVTHSVGMLCFIVVSCCAWARGKLKSAKSSPLTPTALRQQPIDSTCLAKVSLLVIQVRNDETFRDECRSISLTKIIVPFTLQVLAVTHHVTWLPLFMVWLLLFGRTWSASQNDVFPVCFHCCSQPSTSKDPFEKQRKRLITYKMFILFILSAMMTSLTFTLRSRIALDRSETIAAICVLVIAGKIRSD